jgi:tryptophan synthase alpha chain
MSPSRIADTFKELATKGRTGIVPYIPVGFPDMATTLELVPALAKAGADIIELGVPFSDPMADGTTIQKAGFQALKQGITLSGCLEACASLRERGLETPLVLMGYYNPVLAFGLERFAEEAQRSGVDGAIVPDLPPGESEPLRERCGGRGIDVICMLAPTSTDDRIQVTCATATGFIYCVSLAGVTGARTQVSDEGRGLVERVRGYTDLPVAVGFGISRPEHVEQVGRYADAAIVGSALVNVIDQAPAGQAVAQAASFLVGLRKATESPNRGAE